MHRCRRHASFFTDGHTVARTDARADAISIVPTNTHAVHPPDSISVSCADRGPISGADCGADAVAVIHTDTGAIPVAVFWAKRVANFHAEPNADRCPDAATELSAEPTANGNADPDAHTRADAGADDRCTNHHHVVSNHISAAVSSTK